MKGALWLLIVALLALPQAAAAQSATEKAVENLDKIGRSIDEVTRQRDFFARMAMDKNCRDFINMRINEETDSAIVLKMMGAAKPEATVTVVDSEQPRPVCIVKIGGECILNFDGESFVSTRPLRVEMKK